MAIFTSGVNVNKIELFLQSSSLTVKVICTLNSFDNHSPSVSESRRFTVMLNFHFKFHWPPLGAG